MEKETEKIKEVPKKTGFTGLTISRDPVKFTPKALLDALGYEEENRPVFMITPMTIKQRNAVDADTAKAASDAILWGKEKGIDVSSWKDIYKYDSEGEILKENNEPILNANRLNEYLSYQQLLTSYSDFDLRSEIVRKNIKDIKVGEASFFKKDESNLLDINVFEQFEPKLISMLFDEINRISNPNQLLTMGL